MGEVYYKDAFGRFKGSPKVNGRWANNDELLKYHQEK